MNSANLHSITPKKKVDIDAHLVSKAQKGDAYSLEQLIKRYEDKIYNLAFHILGDENEAYDVLQETSMSVFQHLNEFKQKSNFSTWLYRIAINTALMKKRKQKKQTVSTETGDNITQYMDLGALKNLRDWSSDPVLNMENKELKKVLDDSLQKIPEKYRSVVVLKDLENRSLEEIAKILNISVPAVKSRLHRARMILRFMLDRYIKQIYGHNIGVSH
ncbi:MAG: sigma-70 family RNA polymerase sigma factor [Endomicrobiia bacterium]